MRSTFSSPFPGETLRLDRHFRLHGPGAAGSEQSASCRPWTTGGEVSGSPRIRTRLVPFHGGWFLFLGYELVRQIEPSIRTQDPPAGPVAFATRIPVALVRNRRSGQAWIVAEPATGGDAALLRQDIRACRRSRMRRRPGEAAGDRDHRAGSRGISRAPSTRIRQLIARGDVYQVNLARRWTATVSPGLQARRHLSPAASDESGAVRRHRHAGRLVADQFVAGTPRPQPGRRGGNPARLPARGRPPMIPALEEARRRDLLANPKERAEHIMLIDLERNDLGRISRARLRGGR